MPATNDMIAPCPSSLPENDSNTTDLRRTASLLPPSNGPPIETTTVPDCRPPNSVPEQEPPDSQSLVMNELDSGLTSSCLANALRLLKQLPSPASTSCQSSRVQGFEKNQGLGQTPSLQSVIAINEKIVQAISDILQCQCSQDGHLLAILSIIIFKVLGWYAAMVRQMPGFDGDGQCWDALDSSHLAQQQLRQAQRTPFRVVDNYCVDGEDKVRIAAQQILSQLHRVQRLVNIFSQRFKIHKGHTEASSSSSSSPSGPVGVSSVESLFYVPGSLLEQIEGDLRKRLRNLSAEIVDTIR
ncbi:aflatoxin regulatory protein-domain-containing protein [Talaromyces proteolyticus]|uniref:Aflatoxin regulatory protein-domain-containing protein n=1 Tax=Talaromyces proteolyticus TaxID=1131652 RepID=A0AAD4Q1K2_9EURO|nr:aflatoxin regulatory protein-domain-containing protein [Talaromyces proteolyticus]KAH8698804.1 aflatoxin regulatory protein-domain-containing protein [Talaromyces proteolyticus]